MVENIDDSQSDLNNRIEMNPHPSIEVKKRSSTRVYNTEAKMIPAE